MNKEQIYDEEISPLLKQIVAVCQQHKIAMLASFAIPNEEHADLIALTNLADETGVIPANHAKAAEVLRPLTWVSVLESLRNGSSTIVKGLITVREFLAIGETAECLVVETRKNGERCCSAVGPVRDIKYLNGVLSWSDSEGDPSVVLGVDDPIADAHDLANDEFTHTVYLQDNGTWKGWVA